MADLVKIKEAMLLYSKLEYAGDRDQELVWIAANKHLLEVITMFESLEKYAKQLAKQYLVYRKQQYEGKNGANSDNEKGYWRGMADSVMAILNDLKGKGLIAHLGLLNDPWPEEATNENSIPR